MTKFLNLATDVTLGGETPQDYNSPSQKAVKTYIHNNALIQVSELPIASPENLGKILQYVGELESGEDPFIPGYLYQCVSESSGTGTAYYWKVIPTSTQSTITIKRFE